MEVSRFDVLKTMSQRNMNIKLSPQENIIDARITGDNAWIKIGVDKQTVYDMLANKPQIIVLLVVDGQQFDDVMRELGQQ